MTSVRIELSSMIEFLIRESLIVQLFPIDTFGPIIEFSTRELSWINTGGINTFERSSPMSL